MDRGEGTEWWVPVWGWEVVDWCEWGRGEPPTNDGLGPETTPNPYSSATPPFLVTNQNNLTSHPTPHLTPHTPPQPIELNHLPNVPLQNTASLTPSRYTGHNSAMAGMDGHLSRRYEGNFDIRWLNPFSFLPLPNPSFL